MQPPRLPGTPAAPSSPSSHPPPASGQRPSFTTIYQEQARYIRDLVVSWPIPSRDVEDLVQQIFLGIYRALPNFDPARPLKPWLRTIAHRILRDYTKLGRTQNERLTPTDPIGAIDPHPNAEAVLVSLVQLSGVLASLNERERKVLRCLVDGTPMETIAEGLGLSTNGAWSLLYRIPDKLTRALRRDQARERHLLGEWGALLLPFGLDGLLDRSPLAALALRARSWLARMGSALGRALAAAKAASASLGAGAGFTVALGAALVPLPSAITSGHEVAPLLAAAMPLAGAIVESAPAPAIGAAEQRPSPSFSSAVAPSTSAPPPDPVEAERTALARIKAMMMMDPTAALVALESHRKAFSHDQFRDERELIEAEARLRLERHGRAQLSGADWRGFLDRQVDFRPGPRGRHNY